MKMCQWPAEVAAFTEFIRTEGVRNVLEIGTGPGGFLDHLGTACDGLLISVDMPNTTDPTGLDYTRCFRRNQELARRHPTKFVGLLGDSHSENMVREVKVSLGYHQLDLLFLDGDDSFEGKLQDFAAYNKFVRDGGIIATHDIVSHGLCGVPKFWEALKLSHLEHFEFVEPDHPWGGIGAVRWAAL